MKTIKQVEHGDKVRSEGGSIATFLCSDPNDSNFCFIMFCNKSVSRRELSNLIKTYELVPKERWVLINQNSSNPLGGSIGPFDNKSDALAYRASKIAFSHKWEVVKLEE